MEETNVFGINESKLDSLVLEFCDTAERISNKFYLIENLVEDTNTFFECSSGDLYRTNFRRVIENFPVVNRNILNYSNDLVGAKQRLYSIEDTVSQNFIQAHKEVLSNTVEEYRIQKN
jgi:hypothetical protein